MLYFDRADRAADVEQWLRIMEVPLAAVPEWERERAERDYEARLSAFLRRAWTGTLQEPDLRTFLDAVEQADRKYLFLTDGLGRITRDEVGDPLLRGAEQAEEDHRRWREELGAAAESLVARWEQAAQVSLHELLGFLQPESRDRVDGGARITLQQYCAEVRREFARLYRQAESRFLATRLRDRYSLRSKSESRTAGGVAAELIRNTQAELDEAMQTLQLGPRAQQPADALALDPQRWQEEFLAQFEKGIQAWSAAEERLLQQRIRWEADARGAFVEGEAAWDAAFAELERAQGAWAEEMNRCLSEGRLAWTLTEQDFLEQFAAVTAELAGSARAELESVRQEAAVLVGVYRQCVELIELAEGNVELLSCEVDSLREEVTAEEGSSLHALLEELEYWQGADGDGGMLARYRDAAEAARGALLDLEARIRAYGQEELPANSLEREIARLEAERSYLQRQVEIAEAVVDYADEAGADRPSEAETANALRLAQAQLLESGRCYEQAVQSLQRLVREEVEAAPLELAVAREALEQAQISLDQSRRRYGDAWSAWGAQDLGVLEALVGQYQEALERWYGAERAAAYRGYMAAWEAFEAAELADQAGALLRDLLGQGEVDRVPDLARLQARSDALRALELEWTDPQLQDRVRECLSAAELSLETDVVEGLLAAVEAGLSGDPLGRLRARQRLAVLRENAEIEQYRHERLAELLERECLSAAQGAAEIEAARSAAERARAAFEQARAELGREALACLEGDCAAVSPEAAALAELLRLTGATGRGAVEEGNGSPADGSGSPAEAEDLRFLLDEMDLRDLFSGEERPALREAQVAVELYDLFGPMLPCLGSYYRTRDAAAWGAALGAGEPGGELAALRSLSSPTEIAGLCEVLTRLPSPSPYLEDLVVRILAHAAAGREPAAGQGTTAEEPAGEPDPGVREWLAAIEEVAVVEERLAQDLEAYVALLVEALAAFGSPDWSRRGTESEAREARAAVWSGERAAVDWLEARVQAEAARDAWAEGFDGYREAVLEPLRAELVEREGAVARCQSEYDQALARFSAVSARYLELHGALQEALAEHEEARVALQQAEEIHAYASNGYRLEASGPETVLAERRRGLARVVEALEVLRAIPPVELQRPFAERMDPGYGEAKAREIALIEGLQQLIAARSGMERASGEWRDLLEAAAERLSSGALEVFSFAWSGGESGSLEFRPDAASVESGELTDFAGCDEQTLAQTVAAYFEGDRSKVSERFSTDVVLWLLGMASYGDGCADLLSQFGVAYYYDAVVQEDLQIPDAPGVIIGILSAPSLQALIGPRYLDLGGRWVQVCTGERQYTECHWEYDYPEEKLTVEDYLARAGRRAYEKVTGDTRAGRLYAFYKAMLASGHLAGGTRFAGKDLSELAYRYVDGKAAALQASLGQWWKFLIHPIWGAAELVKAQGIRDLRGDLATRRVSGASERASLAAAAAEAEQATADERSAAAGLELLCGQSDGGGVDNETFLNAVAEHSGRAVVPAVETIVAGELSNLNAAELRNALSVLAALQQRLEERLAAARSVTGEIAAQNLARRADAYRAYQELLYGASSDRSSLEAAARGLYADPEFSAEDFRDYELESAAGSAAWTLRGEVLRLELCGEALVGLMQERLAAMQSAAHDRLLLQLRELGDRRAAWERSVGEILSVGSAAWSESAARLVESRVQWRAEFEEEYHESRSAWEAARLLLQENRDLWVRESTRTSVLSGAEAIAREMGLELDRLTVETELLFIPDMTIRAPDPDRALREVLDGTTLSNLVDQARELSSRAGGTRAIVAAFLPELGYSTAGSTLASRLASEAGEEVYRRAALVTALQMRRAVEQAREAALENMAEANAGMEESLGDTMASAGYTRSG
ncbi:MAG: hypothetical protein JW820_09875, partial [Spirochaetales bacterium]|nr:hypothetical protein [Spirochaetales bacterium]